MNGIRQAYRRAPAGVLISALLIVGCAGGQNVQKDPFFDKWTTMADTAAGHSPAPRERGPAIIQELLKATGEPRAEEAPAPARKLPTQKVSLKMRQADIKTVLRALARIVEHNILVKSDITGVS